MKIGIDLGGTNYRIGLVDDNYNIVSLIKKTLDTKDANEIVKSIVNDISSFDLSSVSGIGFCAPGMIDVENCTMADATNLDMGGKIEVGKIFNSIFHLPIYIDNDANCAGLAESIVGAGKNHKSVYYITHSTGIGASYIIDGKVIRGAHNCLGEIGSCLLNKQPKLRLEKSSAGPAIALKGKELLGTNITQDVFEEVKKGNKKAQDIIEEVCANLAFTMANIVYIADPECFVLGGGVTNNYEIYKDTLMKYYQYYASEAYTNIPVYKASLSEPGVIGASLLVK